MTDRNEAIKAIKSALKNRSGKSWSVTGGRGSAWGWITISTMPSRQDCAYLGTEGHTCDYACFTSYITPAERAELAALLGLDSVHHQGVSIPSGGAYRDEYVARAAGLTPIRLGTQYWD